MFTVVGTSTHQGQTKVRFANDLVSRVKILVKNGHTDIDLFELPEPMTKAEACDYLRHGGLNIMQDPVKAEAIVAAWEKYHNTRTVKVSGKITVDLESLKARAWAKDTV